MCFFSKMNVPEGVNTEAENLLSRIGIRDFAFCDEFFVILGFFEKFDIFGKIGIFGKSDPRDPQGSTFWERSGSKIGKNEVKIDIYGTNYLFYLNFQDFDPLLGSPRGRSEFYIFQNHQNFQKSGFCKIPKKGISKM